MTVVKRLFYIFCIAALVFNSCQKPEDRLVGYWLLQETHLNGKAVDTSVDTSIYNANIPKMNYYLFYYYGSLSVTSYINDNLVESKSGSWELVDKNQNLNIFLVLYDKIYNYKAKIIKLSNKELKYKYSDDNGDEWTLHLFKR